MTDRPARDARVGAQYGTGQRLNPGELEEIEAAARRGAMLAPNETLAMVNTVTSLQRRIAVRFNETAEARQVVVGLSDRINELETKLKERGQMADLGHLADAVARAERAERALRVWEQGDWLEAGAVRERIAELERERSDMLNNGAAGIVGRRLHQRVAELEAQVGEYQRDAIERTKVVDKIRSRFVIDPGVDLYDALCQRIGDLQTSEAELVSTPLMVRAERAEARVEDLKRTLQLRIEDLEKTLRGRDATIRGLQERIRERDDDRVQLRDARFQITQMKRWMDGCGERERAAVARKDAAEHRAARAARRLEQSGLALEQVHRQRAVDADHARQLRDQVKGVADLVFSGTADQALEMGTVEGWSARASQLAGIVRGVRDVVPKHRDIDPPAGSVHA